MKKKGLHIFIFVCCGIFTGPVFSQTFKLQTREAFPANVPNNATFFQVPLTGTKVQKDFDVVNLTAANQDIIVRKTELSLNVLSVSDKALASYCYGINCHGAEVFADTVNFLPFQSVALEIDFIEASVPGHSLIRYTVQNKNNLNEFLSVFMDYTGVLSVKTHSAAAVQFLVYPNPAQQILHVFDAFAGEKLLTYHLTNVNGTCVKEGILLDQQIDIQGMAAGIYQLRIGNASGQSAVQKIIIY